MASLDMRKVRTRFGGSKHVVTGAKRRVVGNTDMDVVTSHHDDRAATVTRTCSSARKVVNNSKTKPASNTVDDAPVRKVARGSKQSPVKGKAMTHTKESPAKSKANTGTQQSPGKGKTITCTTQSPAKIQAIGHTPHNSVTLDATMSCPIKEECVAVKKNNSREDCNSASTDSDDIECSTTELISSHSSDKCNEGPANLCATDVGPISSLSIIESHRPPQCDLADIETKNSSVIEDGEFPPRKIISGIKNPTRTARGKRKCNEPTDTMGAKRIKKPFSEKQQLKNNCQVTKKLSNQKPIAQDPDIRVSSSEASQVK